MENKCSIGDGRQNQDISNILCGNLDESSSKNMALQDHENNSQMVLETDSESSSLPLIVKSRKCINLVVELPMLPVQNIITENIDRKDDEEMVDHHLKDFSAADEHDIPPDVPTRTHMEEVIYKEGISPVKRGRKGKRNRVRSAPPVRWRKPN